MKQHILLFKNPQLHKGLNITVRDGSKWILNANIGDEVNIYETGKDDPQDRIAQGKIVGLAYIPFLCIPNGWLNLEHDESCRDFMGLLKAMIRAYPRFTAANMVTVILFEL